jgi:hypothetical protein
MKRASLVSKALVATYGIVEGISRALTLEPLSEDPMTLRLSEGIAINNEGELLPIEGEQLIRLSGIAGTETLTYYIQLQAEESLSDPFVDEEMDNLRSYKFRHFGCRVVVSAERLPRAVEIGRIRLNDRISAVSLCSSTEALEAGLGVIDQRHSPRIRVYNANGLDFSRHFHMKSSVTELRESLLEMEMRYASLKMVSMALGHLNSLELEIAESVLAIGRVRVLLGRLQKSLLGLVEEMRELHTPLKNTDSGFWDILFEQIQSLSEGSNLEDIFSRFQEIRHFNIKIREHILDKRTDEEKAILIQQALKDLRSFRFSFSQTHSFGGSLFKRSLLLDGDDVFQMSQFDGEYRTLKNLRAGYEQAVVESEKGLFVSPGKIYFSLKSIDPTRDGIFFFKIYKRRGRQEFSVLLNGNSIRQEALLPHESVDRFLNIAVQVKSEQLVLGENHLVLDVKNVDLDFGLMALAFYQEMKGGEK